MAGSAPSWRSEYRATYKMRFADVSRVGVLRQGSGGAMTTTVFPRVVDVSSVFRLMCCRFLLRVR